MIQMKTGLTYKFYFQELSHVPVVPATRILRRNRTTGWHGQWVTSSVSSLKMQQVGHQKRREQKFKVFSHPYLRLSRVLNREI